MIKIAHRCRVQFTSCCKFLSVSRLVFALLSPTPRHSSRASNRRSLGWHPDRRTSGAATEILPHPVAICRPTNHWLGLSRDRWSTRQTHNVKKTPPTPLITTAPPRMRRRKSFVHFPSDMMSPTWRRCGNLSRTRSNTTYHQVPGGSTTTG